MKIEVELAENGFVISSIEDGYEHITVVQEVYGDDDTKETETSLCFAILESLGIHSNKHTDYRFKCGGMPQSGRAIKEVSEIIGDGKYNDLICAGYEIIKVE